MAAIAVMGQHYYVFKYVSNATWIGSNEAATAIGGHLVTLTSAAEDAFVTQTFTEGFWIGLTDAAQEGTFLWVTSEVLDYTHWAAGEPTNQSSVNGLPENYVHTFPLGRGGGWNDLQSDEHFFISGFVVEFDTATAFRAAANPYAKQSSEFVGSAMDDTITASAGDDSVFGGDGDDLVKGGKGDDRLDGNSGNDTVLGGAGNDVLVAGAGINRLKGGAGSDIFNLGGAFPGSQAGIDDTIVDFHPGEDRIVLAGNGFANFSQVLAATTQVGADLVITSFGHSVTMLHMQLAQFSASDVLL